MINDKLKDTSEMLLWNIAVKAPKSMYYGGTVYQAFRFGDFLQLLILHYCGYIKSIYQYE